MVMKELFDRLTGNKRLIPHPYQEKVAECLLRRNNIVLCAPTGAGKTWAALLPFLLAKRMNAAFADRLIYVLPLRTLASTIYKETSKACMNVFKVKNLPENRTGEEDELVMTIQTGEQKDDPFFEGDLIFTTVDQCLSSYINMPVSLPGRIGNINAGALLGSLVIFDELHLLDPDRSMKTAVEMLRRLKPFSQFIVMTATLSGKSLSGLGDLLDAEVIQLKKDEVLSLPSHKDKKRTYRWVNKPLNIEDIVEQHNSKRSIVIVNTVARAQQIFMELHERLKDSGTAIFLLHSRFYSEDRKKTEEVLGEWFGKNASRTNVILVTTQVVEAGIDISADNLHTEIAPLNSIIQRAGRCARYEGERGIGTVWIYELESDDKGRPKLGPYRDREQAILVDKTRVVLEKLNPHGEIIDFTMELSMIDEVHAEKESSFINTYMRDECDLQQGIFKAMDGSNLTAIRDLIRDASSVNLIICDDPHKLRFDREKWPRMLSAPRTSLYRLTPFFEESRDFGETVAWQPTEETNIIDDESSFRYGWEPITCKEQLHKIQWLIVINPKFASYSEGVGLQIGVSGDFKEIQYFDRPLTPRYRISYETYREHIEKVVEQCRFMDRYCQNTLKRVASFYGVSPEHIKNLTEITCTLHDVGKLSIKWQNAVRKWQQYKNSQKITDEPLAHSDYNPETDFAEKAKFPKQPAHASEGAYAVAVWLRSCFGDNAIAVWTAIARHHGAFTETLADFGLIDDVEKWVAKTLPASFGEIKLTNKPDRIVQNTFKDDLLNFTKNSEDAKLWPLYVFLVRRLRLADQKSQKGGKT